jgi:hypothetical protein
MITGDSWSPAFAQSPQEAARLEKLEAENAALKSRLDALEAYLTKEGDMPVEKVANKTLKFLGESTISGFVTASYFYDFSKPADGVSNGYLWDDNFNSFTLNKVKLTLENPVERSGSDWDTGYSISMIYGSDAPFVNTGGERQGFEDLRQAYLEANVPVGTGLNVRAGQLISLLNYESGDGGAVNANFSQGNQWFFTGNGPAVGGQVGYVFSDAVDLRMRLQNGLYSGAVDNNDGKTFMASLGIKPDDKTWINVIPFAGEEPFGGTSGVFGSGDSEWLTGINLLAGRKLAEKYNLNVATELTYMHWADASVSSPGDSADAYSAGLWVSSDFNEKVGLALRGDYVNDRDGTFTSGLLGFPTNGGQELYSLTLTLNYRPHPSFKIQPEIRYDKTTMNDGFDGAEDRIVAGVGASYLF